MHFVSATLINLEHRNLPKCIQNRFANWYHWLNLGNENNKRKTCLLKNGFISLGGTFINVSEFIFVRYPWNDILNSNSYDKLWFKIPSCS